MAEVLTADFVFGSGAGRGRRSAAWGRARVALVLAPLLLGPLAGGLLAGCDGPADAAGDVAGPDRDVRDTRATAPDLGPLPTGCAASGTCGDGLCCEEGGESSCGCPSDCGWPACGDGACCAPAGEDVASCPADCGASACGDGTCGDGETPCACAADCGGGTCGDGECCATTGEDPATCAPDCGAACGDGVCSGDETHAACAADCAAGCGDGGCAQGESACGCAVDCGAETCGNGICCAAGGETSCACPADCGAGHCGDGTCCAADGETAATCAADCVAVCGDGTCSGDESPADCPADCAADCGPDGSCRDGLVPCECPGEAAAVVGPGGGSVEVPGIRLTIPPGALAGAETLRVRRLADAPPEGYTPYSPVFRFEPDGLSFEQPATVELAFEGEAARATLFWSHPDRPGFEWLAGDVAGDRLTAPVTHFSRGFVGDGVWYTDPPDTSCAALRLLEPPREVPPSGLALFFAVDDCFGNPVTDLAPSDFVVKEDGNRLSAEAYSDILRKPGLTAFVTLTLDLSASTDPLRTDLVAAARSFVDHLRERLPDRVLVSLEAFAGEQAEVLQEPTLDLDVVAARLDEVLTVQPEGAGSTNLHGAILGALERSDRKQQSYLERNRGGAFTTGYVVVFTDGSDQAGYHSAEDVAAAVAGSSTAVLGVGFASADYDEAALAALAPAGVFTAADPGGLQRTFGALANRIAGQVQRTYLLGYCSPKRAGEHTVTIELAGATTLIAASATFDAEEFASGCGEATFRDACAGKECGGLGCGACDDREAICAGGSACRPVVLCCQLAGTPCPEMELAPEEECWARLYAFEDCLIGPGVGGLVPGEPDTCTSFCVRNRRCGGQSAENPFGYEQYCEDAPDSTLCDGACRDLRSDEQHCGACGVECAAGATCESGECVCPGAMGAACDGVCHDLAIDQEHCGACGTSCAVGATCESGQCVCPGEIGGACNGLCYDLAVDQEHCGNCSTECAAGATCAAGQCVCPGEMGEACHGVCHDLAVDDEHCGECDRSCTGCDACDEGRCAPAEACCGGRACPRFSGYSASCNPQNLCEYANSDPTGWRAWDVWIRVPAGFFPMGTDGGIQLEGPQHTVTFAQGFLIAKHEVTVAQYAACQAAGVCTATENGNTADAEPRDQIDWQQAQDVCGFLGGRLPSEAEWEYAARGPDARTYPWGEADPACALAHYQECGGDVLPVGSLPAGAAWSGALDMAGNVWEWVEDCFHDTYAGAPTDGSAWVSPPANERVVRSGAFSSPGSFLRAASRLPPLRPESRGEDLGVRCVRGPLP